MKSIVKEISALRAMDVKALVEKYKEIFGTEPQVRQKTWLFKKIAFRLQEQRHNGQPGGESGCDGNGGPDR